MTQEQQQRAAFARRRFERRNLTQYAAHRRFGISRETLTKVWDGQPVTVDALERVAEALGDDPNDWREMWEYPRLGETKWSTGAALFRGLQDLVRKYGLVEVPFPFIVSEDLRGQVMSVSQIDLALEVVEAEIIKNLELYRNPPTKRLPSLDNVDVREFHGAEDLPPEDLEVLNHLIRTFVEEKRRRARAVAPPESPRDYFWTGFGEIVDTCNGQGLPAPAVPRFAGGSESLESVEAAEAVLDGIRKDVEKKAGRKVFSGPK